MIPNGHFDDDLPREEFEHTKKLLVRLYFNHDIMQEAVEKALHREKISLQSTFESMNQDDLPDEAQAMLENMDDYFDELQDRLTQLRNLHDEQD